MSKKLRAARNGLGVFSVFAMAAAPAQEPSGSAPAIEEVVVTAQKRAESLQDVPLSVTALTANTIENARIEALQDVATRTPNFSIGQQNASEPELTIRGIGSTDREAGSDRSVTVFVDEVYIGRAGASTFDLFDLERVEVLRGPQGTLSGRNVVGGAISLVTAKPTRKQEGKVQLTAGTDDLWEVRGVYNQPLSDTTALRIAASAKERDGYFVNSHLDADGVGAPASRNARVHLASDLTERLHLLFSLDYSTDELDGVPSRMTKGAATDAQFAAAMASFGNYVPPADPYAVENNVLGHQERDIFGASTRLTYTTDNFDITFLPAYRTTDYISDRDIAGIPIVGSGPSSAGWNSREIIDEQYDATSAELRFSSPQAGGRLSWVTGLYYLNEDIHRKQTRETQLGTAYSRPLFDQSSLVDSAAVFAQATYALTERLRITGGARYTQDKKEFELDVSNTLSPEQIAAITADLGVAPNMSPAAGPFSLKTDKSWSQFTPKLTLDYSLTDNALLYLSAANGFKSGGFNGFAATAAILARPFDPETVWNFELGSKTMFWDRRLQINAAIFQLNFDDLQLRDRQLLVPGNDATSVVNIINAAKARIHGAEAEFIVLPLEHLQLSGYASYLDSEVTEVGPRSTIIVGTQLPRAPENTLGFSATYDIPVRVGTFSLRADYRHTGEQYFDINEPLASREPEFNLLDLRLGFTADSGGWGLALWCKNVTDEYYRSHVQQISSGRAGVTNVGDPRSCGVTFNKDFGDAQ